ncbi:unnamed protein product [Adineta ricciae]|uniref:Uncharacterized protein n=1 Tax=Adineta ricciae TaxID=249248 RepID=A0A814JYN5_ADIRI|nr:unnamed protein product [Adineta ricciae]CAF1247572.1 unnamed protein product [Adineta ricciae]
MPELFTLQPAIHNRKNPSFRQSSKLLNYNQSTKRPSKNTYQERTEIYYVPETTKNGPIYNKQPHKSPTPSVHSDDLIPDDEPGLYHLPTSNRANRPTARKIYYKPLRYNPKYVAPRNKPLTPPVRKANPAPAPPLTKSTRASTPPMRKSTPPSSLPGVQSYPTPSPSPPTVASYQPLILGAPELYHLDHDKAVYRQPTPVLQQPYKSPSPSPEKSHRTPPPPVQEQQPILRQTYPLSLGPTELYHLDRVTTSNSPVQPEPKRLEQSYKSPPPPVPSAKQSALPPPPSAKLTTPPPQLVTPINTGAELYHLDQEDIEYPPVSEEPKRVESSYKTPPPASAPKLTAPPPASIGPELYHLNKDDTVYPIVSEEPKHVEQVHKSPPPPPIQAISPPPQQLMSKLNTPPVQRPEFYHMDFNGADPEPILADPKPVEPSYHSPLPSAKKSSPVPVDVPPPPSQNGPELYHMKVDVSDSPPVLQEPPHRTPTPLPTPVLSKPASAPPPPPSPPQNKPEVYYIKLDERPESQAAPLSKPATPRVPSGKNRVSPMPSTTSLRPGPEMYYLQTVVDEISRPPSVHEVVTPEKAPTPKPATPQPILTKARTPPPRVSSPPRPRRRTPTPPRRQRTPTPPRRRPPVGRPIRTAAPLALPNRKPKRPVYDDDDDDDVANIPTRRPSFSTALQDVLTSDRTVPLSTSKASDSIIRSMNKFRFPEE